MNGLKCDRGRNGSIRILQEWSPGTERRRISSGLSALLATAEENISEGKH